MLQGVQLLVCDGLLTARTAVWQDDHTEGEAPGAVCQAELLAFQRDLTSLRRLAQALKVAMPRVRAVSSLRAAGFPWCLVQVRTLICVSVLCG